MRAVVKLEPVIANPATVGDQSTAWLIRGCPCVLCTCVLHMWLLYCTVLAEDWSWGVGIGVQGDDGNRMTI